MHSHSHLIWLIIIFPLCMTPKCRPTVEKFKFPIIGGVDGHVIRLYLVVGQTHLYCAFAAFVVDS